MKNVILTIRVGLVSLCLILSNNFLLGQCNTTEHSTNAKDNWLSCQPIQNPNVERGVSHWIQYDLGYLYELGATKFWNYNASGQTGHGFKSIVVDYSIDGVSWIEAGNFQLPQATGQSDYKGEVGLDLSGITARFLLITALTNWDNGPCSGISEFRVDVKHPNNTCWDYIVLDELSDNSILSGTYFGENDVVVSGQIKDKATVTLKSPKSIIMSEGFSVEEGSNFLARIDNCDLQEFATEKRSRLISIIEDKTESNRILVYPNPVSALLTIDYGGIQVEQLIIASSSGYEIIKRKNKEISKNVDVSNLPTGLYFITVVGKKDIYTKSFVRIDK